MKGYFCIMAIHKHQHHYEHDHGLHGHAHSHAITKNLKVAFALNLCFTIIEFIGGFFTNSIAILSDAIHDLGDTIAIGSALFLEKNLNKKETISLVTDIEGGLPFRL